VKPEKMSVTFLDHDEEALRYLATHLGLIGSMRGVSEALSRRIDILTCHSIHGRAIHTTLSPPCGHGGSHQHGRHDRLSETK
jgi:hypothetical protein